MTWSPSAACKSRRPCLVCAGRAGDKRGARARPSSRLFLGSPLCDDPPDGFVARDFSQDVSHRPEANAKFVCDGFLASALRVQGGNLSVQGYQAGVVIQPTMLKITMRGLLAHPDTPIGWHASGRASIAPLPITRAPTRIPSYRHRPVFVHRLGLFHNAVEDKLELLGADVGARDYTLPLTTPRETR